MKKFLALAALYVFVVNEVNAQIKIGDNPQYIDPSAVLELESSSKALILTRHTNSQMNAMSPGRGALVYNIDEACVFYYDGAQWVNLCEGGTAPNGISFTTNPVVNDVDGNETIVITQNGTTYNFEVAPSSITSAQIVDGGINGVDIQNGSIGQNKLTPDAVERDNIATNAVGLEALDIAEITLSTLTNVAGFLTGNIVSPNANNSISDANGAFYEDADPDAGNELQDLGISGSMLTITAGSGVDLGPILSSSNTDSQDILGGTLSPTNQLTIDIENGNSTAIDLSGLAVDGSETQIDPGTNVTITGTGTLTDPYVIAAAGGGGGNSTDELNQSFQVNGTALEIVDAGGTLSVPLTDLSSGTDTNTTNVSLATTDADSDGTDDTLTLTDSDGNPVNVPLADLSSGTDTNTTNVSLATTDADSDGTDDTLTLTDSDGNPVNMPLADLAHTGTPNFIFFADPDGKPTTTQDDAYTNGNGGLYWNPEARFNYGALFIGLDGGSESDIAKLHVAEAGNGRIAYPILIQNQTFQNNNQSSVGMLFSIEATGGNAHAKGALVYERKDHYGVGDFHFLQNPFNNNASYPEISHKALTIKNNKDIQLYGGLVDSDATPTTGNAGEILSSTGTGVAWVTPGSSNINGSGTIDVTGTGTSANPYVIALKLASVNGSFGTGGSSNIVPNTIGPGDIAHEAIGSAEIQMDAVKQSEIADDAVGSDEIIDGAIMNIDINAGANIAGTKINPDFGALNIQTTGNITGTLVTATGDLVSTTGNIIATVGSFYKGVNDLHPDYVFEKYFLGNSNLKADYVFEDLKTIEAFVKKYHHLPGIKSAKTVREEGVWDIGKSNLQNLEKIEELFLHTIAQEKKITSLQEQNQALQEELQTLKNDMDTIKALLRASNEK